MTTHVIIGQSGGDLPVRHLGPVAGVLGEAAVGHHLPGHVVPGDRPGDDAAGELHLRDRAVRADARRLGVDVQAGGVQDHRAASFHRVPPENGNRRKMSFRRIYRMVLCGAFPETF
ncbi:hypothetical protein GCM10020216_002450 [Nonomuraea helvata]